MNEVIVMNNAEFVWYMLEAIELLCILFLLVMCALMLRLGFNSFIGKIKADDRKRTVCAGGNPSHAQTLALDLPNNNRSGARTSA
ncbi:hypothetical protein JAO29_03055 [Edaphobacter sp. HDX4]|uniref:hypothetical protein n=1 Tax=Edaphobacter sp. HDX4 TaxID=2794064 RepID=UPI002FE6B24B